jgi:hypothetical protein
MLCAWPEGLNLPHNEGGDGLVTPLSILVAVRCSNG